MIEGGHAANALPQRGKATINSRLLPNDDAAAVVVKTLLAQRLNPLGDPLEAGVIEVHVSNLRRKIGAERIRTLRGVGYLLSP